MTEQQPTKADAVVAFGKGLQGCGCLIMLVLLLIVMGVVLYGCLTA